MAACALAINLGQIATPVRGSTYHVAMDGRTDGDGSWSKPWPTVEYALSQVGGGKTILVKPGTYSSAIQIGSAYSGTADAPTVVKSEYKRQARIVGSPGYGIYTGSTAHHVVIDGFEVTASQSSGVRMYGSNNTARNCWIHHNTNAGSSGIEAHAVSDTLIENNLVENNGSGEQGQGIYADGVRLTIRANTVRNNAGYGLLSSPAVSNSVLINNLVYGHGTRAGILIQATGSGTAAGNNLVANNTCVGNYTGISVYASTQERVVNNICVDNSYAPFIYSQGTVAGGVENDWNVTRPASPYDGPHTASNQDPLFVDAAGGDYRLMPFSPAIGLANPAYAPATDLAGRPANVPPDAGAYAYDPVALGYCYVAVDGRTDGDGSRSKPWPTVEYALSQVGGGKTILLKPGTYNSAILIGSAYSGTSAAPTVVKSEYKWQARVVGSPGYGIYTGSSAQYVVIDGFEVTASQSTGVRVYGSNNTIRNCYLHHNTNGGSSGIEAHGVSDTLIESNLVENNGSGGLGQGIYADGVRLTIRANTVRNNAGYGLLSSPAVSNSVLINNLVYGHGTRAGILIQATGSGTAAGNNLVANNTCVGNYTGISVYASTQERVVNNICVDNVSGPFFYGSGTVAGGVENDWNVTRPTSPYDGPHTASNRDPLFVDAAGGDYRVMPYSPAIGLANPAYAPATDLAGRPANVPPDAGAYAYDPVALGYYYVAVDGRTDGDGSRSKPWLTVEHALSQVGGGKTILLKPGTYSSAILIGSAYSGTSAAPTVVKSEYKWQARVVGSPGYGIYTGSNAQYVVIDGFEVTASQSSGVRIYGSNNTIRNCWVHHNTSGSSSGIEAHGVSDTLIEGNLVENNGSGGLGQGIYADGVRLTVGANIVRNNASYGLLLYPAITNSVVVNNLVYGHAAKSGVLIQAVGSGTAAGNNLVANNTCVGNHTGIVVNASTQEKLVNNICADNIYAPFAYNQGTVASGVENDWNVTRPASPYDGPHTASNQAPQFMNATCADYRLMPTSPAIGLANPAYAPSTDITGRQTNTPPDAGAYSLGAVPLSGTCTSPADFDRDSDVDLQDLEFFMSCAAGPAVASVGDCAKADFDLDSDVDQDDFAVVQRCYSGASEPVDPNCAN